MEPLLPTSGEPHAPYGLFVPGGPTTPDGQAPALTGLKSASGAQLDLPSDATVRWAGLTVMTSGDVAPDQVLPHGPGGGWYPQRLSRRTIDSSRPAIMGFADVTGIVRGQIGGAGRSVSSMNGPVRRRRDRGQPRPGRDAGFTSHLGTRTRRSADRLIRHLRW